MTGKPIRNILITNDDGYDAAGIIALQRFAAECFCTRNLGFPKIVVVAPDRCRSECGHSVTTTRKLTVEQHGEHCYHVDGTPVDCVRVGLLAIAPETDLVLSGINAGANLGVDLLVSGTVAAAREAAVRGVDSIAISHYRHPDVPRGWEHVDQWLTPVLDLYRRRRKDRSVQFWNVNLPAVDPRTLAAGVHPTIEFCPVDREPIIPRSRVEDGVYHSETDFHGRPRKLGSDVDLCFAGSITISELEAPGLFA